MTEGPDGMVRTSAEVEAAQQADLRSEWLQQNRSVLDGLGPQDRLAWAHQTSRSQQEPPGYGFHLLEVHIH